jgi:tetratricopeptide (TPR) repeat protein
LQLRRRLGDRRATAVTLNNLATLAQEQRDFAAARAMYEEGLAIRRELGDRQGVAIVLGNLGQLAREQGRYKEARERLSECLTLCQDMGDLLGVAYAWEGFAALSFCQEQFARAAVLWGAAAALREQIGSPLTPSERTEYDANVVIARNHLGAARLAAAWVEGQAMSLEQAVEYALPETPTNAFKDDDLAHTPGARSSSSRQQRSKTACAKTET